MVSPQIDPWVKNLRVKKTELRVLWCSPFFVLEIRDKLSVDSQVDGHAPPLLPNYLIISACTCASGKACGHVWGNPGGIND